MRSVFVIREMLTGAWCNSSKFSIFMPNFWDAALFLKKSNAEKAIRDMTCDRGQIPHFPRQIDLYAKDSTYRKINIEVVDVEIVEFLLVQRD